MILATLRTITGRRGSFRGGGLVIMGGVLLALVVVVLVHELRPGRNPSLGGQPLLDGINAALFFLGTIVAILVGALAGSYDVAQGTMRYLVLTGVGRLRIYLARTVAVILAVALLVGAPFLLGTIFVFALPSAAGDEVSASELADVAWTSFLWPVVFGLIAMGIGSVMRSNGPAIAISLLFAFAATPLLALVEAWNETVGDLMLLQALDRVTGAETSVPVALAALAVLAWVSVFWALGGARVVRDEY